MTGIMQGTFFAAGGGPVTKTLSAGFATPSTYESIDGFSTLYGLGSLDSYGIGAGTITECYTYLYYGPSQILYVTISGVNWTSGNPYTSVTIPGIGTKTFASASYAGYTGSATEWQWSVTNPVQSGTLTFNP